MTECFCVQEEGQGYSEKALAKLPLSFSNYQSLCEQNLTCTA